MKILIVDDEKDIGFILGFELQSLGHEVVTFESALEALGYLEKETPDAILCDFQMPRMNGLDLFMWLKERGKEVPFYILTGEPTMDTRQLLQTGIKDILFKPQDLLRLSSIFK
ncbi:MAG: response regulator [Bacteriovoracia bacterium]